MRRGRDRRFVNENWPAAGTFERHHRGPRDFCGHLGAEIASHEVRHRS